MRLTLAIIALLTMGASAVADNKLDGLWKPIPIQLPDGTKIDPYNCVPQEVDGATPIKGNWFGLLAAILIALGIIADRVG